MADYVPRFACVSFSRALLEWAQYGGTTDRHVTAPLISWAWHFGNDAAFNGASPMAWMTISFASS
jgi:hypothetical protein